MSNGQAATLNGAGGAGQFPWSAIYPPGVRWDMPFVAETLPAILERTVAKLGSLRHAFPRQGSHL